MMNPEQLVVDDSLDEVEDAKADQKGAAQELAGPADMVCPRVAPQNIEAERRGYVRCRRERCPPRTC